MYERFTGLAKRAVALAQDEAMDLGHDFIGTEHLLIGLARLPDGVAVRVLREYGVDGDGARARTLTAMQGHDLTGQRSEDAKAALATLGIDVGEIQRRADEAFGPGRFRYPRPPFTPRGKRALEMSLREAVRLGHGYIGTEHLLLGVLATEGGAALTVLDAFDIDLDSLRSSVLSQIAQQAS